MPVISKDKFEGVVKACLAAYCDKKISDTTKNVDPDGYLKLRKVIWYFKPYTLEAKYLLGGTEERPIFVPLGFSARLDGDTEEQKLKTGSDLGQMIAAVNFMREAGMV